MRETQIKERYVQRPHCFLIIYSHFQSRPFTQSVAFFADVRQAVGGNEKPDHKHCTLTIHLIEEEKRDKNINIRRDDVERKAIFLGKHLL